MNCRMNLWQVAKFLKDQQVINAINLDGGGSATYILNGSLANYPSDAWCVKATAKIHVYKQQCGAFVNFITIFSPSANLRSGAVQGRYPLCCVFMRGCAIRRTAVVTGAAWRASACASRAGAGQDVPNSHVRLNAESTGSALRVSRSHTSLDHKRKI